jgi:hypothetical protein
MPIAEFEDKANWGYRVSARLELQARLGEHRVLSASDQSPLSRPAERDFPLPEMSDRAIVAHT